MMIDSQSQASLVRSIKRCFNFCDLERVHRSLITQSQSVRSRDAYLRGVFYLYLVSPDCPTTGRRGFRVAKSHEATKQATSFEGQMIQSASVPCTSCNRHEEAIRVVFPWTEEF